MRLEVPSYDVRAPATRAAAATAAAFFPIAFFFFRVGDVEEEGSFVDPFPDNNPLVTPFPLVPPEDEAPPAVVEDEINEETEGVKVPALITVVTPAAVLNFNINPFGTIVGITDGVFDVEDEAPGGFACFL